MTDRVDELLAAMTLEEKVSLLAGEDLWHLPSVERLGVPRLKMTDGPNGARGADWTAGPPSACFPCGSALAATFDTDLVAQVGRHLAEEARAKRAHVLLGPTVNIHRHPLAGRNFECYSEDPELTAQLAVAYIGALQGAGVSACVKHYVANDSEYERMTISSEVPERALREIYLRPFEAAVCDAGTWSIMAAYNRVGGVHASEHPELLRTILRDEWGFDGMVVSDWGATHSTEPAARAGLDVEMPGPAQHRGRRLVDAVQAGAVEEKVVDGLAAAVLRVAERTGCLDGPDPTAEDEGSADTPDRTRLAREVAAAGIVLLRNEPAAGGRPLLPLDPGSLSSIAVIGPNSDPARIQGGGSAGVSPYREVTPLDGIRTRVGDGVEVRHSRGGEIARSIGHIDRRLLCSRDDDQGCLTVEHFDGPPGGSPPVLRQTVRRIPAGWNRPPAGIDPGRWSMRVGGTITTATSGEHLLQVRATGRVVVRVDGEAVAEAVAGERGARADARLHLAEGVPHDLEVDLVPPVDFGWAAGFDLRHRPPAPDDEVAAAAAVAAGTDVAVVVVGTDNDWETEGRDRSDLALPGRQAELIRAVARANPHTVVVLNTGAPVDVDWIEEVPAALQLWFAGQEAGSALADVLFGDVNPSGRLPTTIPRRLSDTPAFTSYPGEHGQVHYGEGLFVGYRWYDARGIEPAFAFGHGLSYTTFEHRSLAAGSGADGVVTVEVEVANTGERDGHEVVQVYVAPVAPRVARPPKELKAFRRVAVAAKDRRLVRFELGPRAFAHWDPTAHGWRVEPGEYELCVGAASDDIRATTRVVVDLPGVPG